MGTVLLLSWTDNACNEDGFRVLLGTVNISGDLPPGTTQWLQAGFAPNIRYAPAIQAARWPSPASAVGAAYHP